MVRYICLTVLFGYCTLQNAAADDVSFTRDIVPLFKSRCVMCHLPDSGQASLSLHPKGGYANLVGVQSTQSSLLRVAPGNAENSYLYRKLIGTQVAAGGSGERMPFGETALSDEQIERIRRWIEAGAKPD
jgi:hypothetical protein